MTMKFGFESEVSGVIRGTKDIADRFDAVSDTLVDLARGGEDAGAALEDSLKESGTGAEKLERQLKDAMDAAADLGKGNGPERLEGDLKGAGQAVESFEDKAKGAFKSLGDSARKSGDVVGTATWKGAKEAGEATGEFRDEAKANLSEVASSFSGDMDSAVDLVQGTLGGLVSALGPAGLIGTAVAAVGIGLAKAFAEGEADRINKMGEAVNALAVEARGLGGDLSQVNFDQYMEDWGLSIQDTREWWEIWQEKAKTGLDVIKERSRDAGVGWQEAFKGTKGSMEDAKAGLEEVNKKLQEATESQETYTDAVTGATWQDPGEQKRIDALKELKKGYEDNISTQEQAAEANRLLEEAGVKTTDQIQKEKDAVEEANDALEEHATKLQEAAGTAMSADQAALDYADTLKSSAADIKANGKNIDANTAAGAANRQTLIDLAGSANDLIQAQVNQGASTDTVRAKAQAARDSFIAQAIAAGFTGEEARKLADRYGLIPKNVDTYVKAHNVAKTKGEIDGVAKPREVPVNLVRGTESVSSWLRGLSGQTIPVNLAVRGGRAVTD
ncbi:tape measure protein [Arthrobacter phage Noely]|uniref:Tape measure protein n=1 Tax=Arthrobacter phage Noely TaxID=2419964 RepID=A0A3G2KAE7_9CAUD|nr:tape measure protein [Arthrobacter phage Noely]AYN55951.1 tape measure protein [Arthrobacter phage Noely]